MSAQEFRDDDAGYLQWLATHRDGFVINIARNRRAADARIHCAECRTISGQNRRGGPWTEAYVKVCADTVAELEHWATSKVTGRPSDGAEFAARVNLWHPLRPLNQPGRPTRILLTVRGSIFGGQNPEWRWLKRGPTITKRHPLRARGRSTARSRRRGVSLRLPLCNLTSCGYLCRMAARSSTCVVRLDRHWREPEREACCTGMAESRS